jgi:MFS family permease
MIILGGRIRLTAAGRALHHRNYRLFFIGQLISVTGTNMQTLAQAWLVGTLVGWNQAVVYIGLLGIVQTLPVMVLSLFGGIIADIWPKRRTLIATQAAAGALALVLGGLSWFGVVAVWHVFLLGFLLGVVNAIDMPTRQAFVMEMVGRDDVANGVALNSALMNGARIVGPAMAGIVIGVFGTALCFILNGLSFAAVIVGLLVMREAELLRLPTLARPGTVGEVGSNLAEGLHYAWETPLVRLVLVTIGIVNIFGLNFFNIVLPVLAASTLKVGASGLGFLSASLGLGALASALAVAAMERPRLKVLVAGCLLVAIAELVLAATTSFEVALVAVFVTGVGLIASSASGNSLIQLTVPGPLRGRVMSMWTTVVVGSSPLGNVLTGAVGGLLGISAALIMAGATVLVADGAAVVAVMRGYLHTEAGSPHPTKEEVGD